MMSSNKGQKRKIKLVDVSSDESEEDDVIGKTLYRRGLVNVLKILIISCAYLALQLTAFNTILYPFILADLICIWT